MTDHNREGARQWDEILKHLLQLFGQEIFDRWLKPLSVYAKTDEELTLCAPNGHIRENILAHYQHAILMTWNKLFSPIKQITVLSTNTHPHLDTSPRILINNTSLLEEKHVTENFMVGKSNELAFCAVQRIAESSVPPSGMNPLFIYGGVGLGKTHMLHALCWKLTKRAPACRFIYMSAERFMHHFVTSIRNKNTLEFRKILRSVDVLMVDDVQFIAGKESTQEEFFHTFNCLVDQKKQIVISADKSPSELGLEERVRSRLGQGLIASVYPATYELRLGILQNKAELLGIYIPEQALELLAKRITTSIRELEGALNSIVAFATLIGKPITMELAQEALHDLRQTQVRQITIQEVQKVVANHFTISVTDLLSPKRLRAVARPRQIAMYLCRELTQHSSTDIGNQFGGKDHTTVVHAVKNIHRLMDNDPAFMNEVKNIKNILRAS
ncbi:MAG: chromosomal replication initiator protein DnaA [Alphaproteobacteria bacterium]|nr:chromosomal replication initiator protein DnaA [Alphaproteobacteria bacterium]